MSRYLTRSIFEAAVITAALVGFLVGCNEPVQATTARQLEAIYQSDLQTASGPVPPGAQAVTNAVMVTNSPPKPPPRVPVTVSWHDERMENTNVAGYDIFAGPDPLALPLVGTITNWPTPTNYDGRVLATLSNVPVTLFYFSVNAFDRYGDYSAESQFLEFVPPGWVYIDTNAVVWFYNTGKTTLQSRKSMTNLWQSELLATNPGLFSFTNAALIVGTSGTNGGQPTTNVVLPPPTKFFRTVSQ